MSFQRKARSALWGNRKWLKPALDAATDTATVSSSDERDVLDITGEESLAKCACFLLLSLSMYTFFDFVLFIFITFTVFCLHCSGLQFAALVLLFPFLFICMAPFACPYIVFFSFFFLFALIDFFFCLEGVM